MNIVKCEKILVVPKTFADALEGFWDDMLDCGYEDFTQEILEAIATRKESIYDLKIRYEQGE